MRAAQVRERLGLPGMSAAAARLVRDKSVMATSFGRRITFPRMRIFSSDVGSAELGRLAAAVGYSLRA
jgi:hypothetical protein